MAGALPQRLPQHEPLGAAQLVAVAVRRHLVSLVHDHQVPVRHLNLGHQLLGPGQLVHPSDEQVLLSERVARARRLHRGTRHQLERQAELVPQLVLPLLDQAAGGDNQATGDVAAQHQLPDQQPRHDRLARTRVIGQQEPQRPLSEQPVVDRVDLMRIRIDVRRVHRRERIGKVGLPHTAGLRSEAEHRAVSVEAPTPFRHLGQPGQVVGQDDSLSQPTITGPVGQRGRVRAVHRNGDHGYHSVRHHPR